MQTPFVGGVAENLLNKGPVCVRERERELALGSASRCVGMPRGNEDQEGWLKRHHCWLWARLHRSDAV